VPTNRTQKRGNIVKHCYVCKTELTSDNSFKRNGGKYRAGICKECDQNRCFIDRWRKKPSDERQTKIKRLKTMLILLKQIEMENQQR